MFKVNPNSKNQSITAEMAEEMAQDIPVSYPSKRCNIVVLGVMGSGKSTVANKILRHKAFDVAANPTSVTKMVSCAERVIEGPGKVMYSVKVVDTVGFSDPDKDPDIILKDLRRFFQTSVVEGVSLVLFVSRKRFTNEVIETIERIKENFKEISPMSALVITNCDAMTEEARAELLESIKRDKASHVVKVCSFMKKGIYAVGFPDLKDTREEFKPIYEKVMEADIKTLHQVIYQSTEMRLTSDMLYDEKFWDKVKESEVINPQQSVADSNPELPQSVAYSDPELPQSVADSNPELPQSPAESNPTPGREGSGCNVM